MNLKAMLNTIETSGDDFGVYGPEFSLSKQFWQLVAELCCSLVIGFPFLSCMHWSATLTARFRFQPAGEGAGMCLRGIQLRYSCEISRTKSKPRRPQP